MDYLTQQNKRLRQEAIDDPPISAKQKHVIVIGGGDTGSDCIGTANRQQARSITQLEILATPPQKEAKYTTWPYWPHKLRTSTSQQEGVKTNLGNTNQNIPTKKITTSRLSKSKASIGITENTPQPNRKKHSRLISCCSLWAFSTPSMMRCSTLSTLNSTHAATLKHPIPAITHRSKMSLPAAMPVEDNPSSFGLYAKDANAPKPLRKSSLKKQKHEKHPLTT